MNYILKLKSQRDNLHDQFLAVREEISCLLGYLQSSKFYGGSPLDGYVNTNDVISRITPALDMTYCLECVDVQRDREKAENLKHYEELSCLNIPQK